MPSSPKAIGERTILEAFAAYVDSVCESPADVLIALVVAGWETEVALEVVARLREVPRP